MTSPHQTCQILLTLWYHAALLTHIHGTQLLEEYWRSRAILWVCTIAPMCALCVGVETPKTDYISQADRSRRVLNDPVIAFCSPVVREPFAPIKLKSSEVLHSGHAVEHRRVVTQWVVNS